MPIQQQGFSGVTAEVDSERSQHMRKGVPGFGTVGGGWAVSGGPAGIVAATLAASTTLMSARVATGATKSIYVTRARVVFASATVGASAGVPGQIAWQKFTTATPTGGSARTPFRKNPGTGGAGTDLSDVRDNNAALTVTSVVFTDIMAQSVIPNFTTGDAFEWVWDMDDMDGIPAKFSAGDGFCLRTQVVMPGTLTWVFSYTVHYFEK
jgi:hypothetical protein